jgi:serine/threonine protein kinase
LKTDTKRALLDDHYYQVITTKTGGMGRVWLLMKDPTEQFDWIYRSRLAVKTFDFVNDERIVEQELNHWVTLDHPGILPLIKIGRLNFQLAAVMPMREGSLHDLLEDHGALSEKEVLSILRQLVSGLDYAYRHWTLLHLDLKPSNVLILSKKPLKVQIADWGISRLAGEQMLANTKARKGLVNRDGMITSYAAGTPIFMAPERFSGVWSFSPQADIYSLGMMAIMLATGVLPFRFGLIDPIEEIVTGSYFENAKTILRDRSSSFARFCLECIRPLTEHRLKNYEELLRHAR